MLECITIDDTDDSRRFHLSRPCRDFALCVPAVARYLGLPAVPPAVSPPGGRPGRGEVLFHLRFGNDPQLRIVCFSGETQ